MLEEIEKRKRAVSESYDLAIRLAEEVEAVDLMIKHLRGNDREIMMQVRNGLNACRRKIVYTHNAVYEYGDEVEIFPDYRGIGDYQP